MRPLPFDDIVNDDGQPESDAQWLVAIDLAVAPLLHLILGLLFMYDLPLFLSSAAAMPMVATVAYRAKRSMEIAQPPIVPCSEWLLDVRFLVRSVVSPARTRLLRLLGRGRVETGVFEAQMLNPFERVHGSFATRMLRVMEVVGNNRDLFVLFLVFCLYVVQVVIRSPWSWDADSGHWLLLDKAGQKKHPLLDALVVFVLPSMLSLFGSCLFVYVHCGSPPSSRKALWTRFDNDEGHKVNRRFADSWKLGQTATDDTATALSYAQLVCSIQPRLNVHTAYDVYHYYGVCGGVVKDVGENELKGTKGMAEKLKLRAKLLAERMAEAEGSVHFASIVEFKAPGEARLVLRCEYGTTHDVGVHIEHCRTVLNLYDHSECIHTGNQSNRESFPMVTYLGKYGSNHLFNGNPVKLYGDACARLLAECLRHASQPSGTNYSHIPDPSKGDVNCMYYSAKFATPGMAANVLGARMTSLWLRGKGLVAASLERLEGSSWLRRMAHLALMYSAIAITYGISSALMTVDGQWMGMSVEELTKNCMEDLAFDADRNGVTSPLEYVKGLLYLSSFMVLLLGLMCALALSDTLSPVQLVGIPGTLLKMFWVTDARFGMFIKLAFSTQLCLIFGWPIGALVFHFLKDLDTVRRWILRGVMWPSGVHNWARSGFPQTDKQRSVNSLHGVGWHRVWSMWCCVIYPMWKLSYRLAKRWHVLFAAWKKLFLVLRPLLKIMVRSPQSIFTVASASLALSRWQIAFVTASLAAPWVLRRARKSRE